jgi:ArsR family transcriptional regulator
MTDRSLYALHALVCQTLANPKRLEIIASLRDGERSVGDLAETLEASQSNVSQHLAVMRQNGIVVARREGLNVYYRIANPKIVRACKLMREVLLERLHAGAKMAQNASP